MSDRIEKVREKAQDFAATPRMNVGTFRDRLASAFMSGAEAALTLTDEEWREGRDEIMQIISDSDAMTNYSAANKAAADSIRALGFRQEGDDGH